MRYPQACDIVVWKMAQKVAPRTAHLSQRNQSDIRNDRNDDSDDEFYSTLNVKNKHFGSTKSCLGHWEA